MPMFTSVQRVWKRREGKKDWQHERSRQVYGEGMRTEVEKDWTRADAVSMGRLRSGHLRRRVVVESVVKATRRWSM